MTTEASALTEDTGGIREREWVELSIREGFKQGRRRHYTELGYEIRYGTAAYKRLIASINEDLHG